MADEDEPFRIGVTQPGCAVEGVVLTNVGRQAVSSKLETNQGICPRTLGTCLHVELHDLPPSPAQGASVLTIQESGFVLESAQLAALR